MGEELDAEMLAEDLHDAAYDGDLSALKELLREKKAELDIDATDATGATVSTAAVFAASSKSLIETAAYSARASSPRPSCTRCWICLR